MLRGVETILDEEGEEGEKITTEDTGKEEGRETEKDGGEKEDGSRCTAS